MFADIEEHENRVIHVNHGFGGLFIDNIGYNNFRFIQGVSIMRRQDFFTLHVVLSGSGMLHIGGNSYRLSAGDVFCCPPDESFSYYPAADDPWEYVWFAVSGAEAETGLSGCGFSVQSPCICGAGGVETVNLVRDFFLVVAKYPILAPYKASETWHGVLVRLLMHTGFDGHFTKLSAPLSHVNRAKSCIENNHTNPEFKIEHVSRLIFISHTYLCRIFLKGTGCTLKGYLMRCRLQTAKKLLTDTRKPVREVAELSGFGDDSQFCKMFLKYNGITAAQFRSQNDGA